MRTEAGWVQTEAGWVLAWQKGGGRKQVQRELVPASVVDSKPVRAANFHIRNQDLTRDEVGIEKCPFLWI